MTGGWRLGFMGPDFPTVRLNLWRADAVVLFDWLMSVDLDAVPISHPAEKQALVDLLSRFEQDTDVTGTTQDEIDTAREEVARDMGWGGGVAVEFFAKWTPA